MMSLILSRPCPCFLVHLPLVPHCNDGIDGSMCYIVRSRLLSVTDLDSMGISCPQLFAAVDPHAVSAEGAVGATGPPCLCGDLHPWDGGFESPLGPRVPHELDPRGIHTQLPCCSASCVPSPAPLFQSPYIVSLCHFLLLAACLASTPLPPSTARRPVSCTAATSSPFLKSPRTLSTLSCPLTCRHMTSRCRPQ